MPVDTTSTQTLNETESAGFAQWFQALLRRLFGGAESGTASIAAPGGTADQHQTDDSFIVAPGGYRIRVPQMGDLTHSVDEVLPDVREGLNLLPPLPMVVLELLKEIQNPASTAASVAQIAANDPSLAASLLRTVNGAASGLSRKVTSVAEAVSYLGFGVVRSLVVQLRLEQVMPLRDAATAIETEDLWVHSLAVSYIADALADRLGDVDRGFVSTLGLLHDIGQLAIVAQFPDRASASHVAPAANNPSESRLDRERRAFGADHAVLGATLALRWKLPADLTQAIRWHHEPEKAFESHDPLSLRKAVCVIHLADQLAKYCFAYADDMEIQTPAQSVFDLLGLPASIPRLLDAKVRAAAGKAILLADETSKRPSTAVRPFLKLNNKQSAAAVIERLGGSTDAPARISVGERGTTLFAAHENPCRFGRAIRPAADEPPHLIAPASGEGIDWILKTVSAQWNAQSISPRQYAPMRTALRALLANLADPKNAAPPTEIELAHQRADGRLEVAVRSPRLAFASRLPDGVRPGAGCRVLEVELANLLNLGWFEIETTADGAALFLRSR
jgi:putative nucleotidyltransferase with HDIG domain